MKGGFRMKRIITLLSAFLVILSLCGNTTVAEAKEKTSTEQSLEETELGTDIISIIVSVLLLITTAILYFFQLVLLQNKAEPYPLIISVIGRFKNRKKHFKEKSISKTPVYSWLYFGDKPNLDEDANKFMNIKKIKLEDNLTLYNEIINNRNKIYFSKIMDQDCIVFNSVSNRGNVIIEFCSAEFVIKNFGNDMKDISLLKAKITFNDKKVLDLGFSETGNYIPGVIQKNKKRKFVVCQITSDFKNNFCIKDLEFVKKVGHEYDMLKKRANDKVYNYSKIDIFISCRNIINSKKKYCITLSKDGYFFTTKTKKIIIYRR